MAMNNDENGKGRLAKALRVAVPVGVLVGSFGLVNSAAGASTELGTSQNTRCDEECEEFWEPDSIDDILVSAELWRELILGSNVGPAPVDSVASAGR